MRMFKRGIGLWVAVVWLGVLAGTAILISWWGANPLQMNLPMRLAPPSASHLFGTDELGRDLLTRLLYAARFTLLVTTAATALSLTLGFFLGAAAAWFGHSVDAVVMVLVNVFWSVPFAVFAVLLVTIIGANAWTLILAIGGINWVTSARVFRAEMRRVRRSDFLRAARANGFGWWNILVTHALPNLRATVLGVAGYAAAETVALESGLAFLGLSLPPPLPTWGGIMANGIAYLSTSWWISVAPAVAVTLTLASFRTLASHADRQTHRYS